MSLDKIVNQIEKTVEKQIKEKLRQRIGFDSVEQQTATHLLEKIINRLSGSSITWGSGVVLSDYDLKAHTHIIGTTQFGKSKFIENLIRQHILRGDGLFLGDPKGTLYKDILHFCAYHGVEKVCLIDPSQHQIYLSRRTGENIALAPRAKHSKIFPSFDPLKAGPGAVSEAIASAFGEDWKDTPRLSKYMTALLEILSKGNYTLIDARYFMFQLHDKERRYILSSSKVDPDVKNILLELDLMWKRDRAMLFDSTTSRFEFILNPTLQAIFGERDNSIDLQQLVDDNWIILVNLNPKGWTQNRKHATIFGTLILNSLLHCYPKEPFRIFVDEVGYFATPTLRETLELHLQSKFSLYLAHHFLSQLDGVRGLRTSILQTCGNKVVFQCPDFYEASRISKLMDVTAQEIRQLEKTWAYASIQGKTELMQVPYVDNLPDCDVDSYIKWLYDRHRFYSTSEEVLKSIFIRRNDFREEMTDKRPPPKLKPSKPFNVD